MCEYPVCLVFLLSQLLMCFDVSPIDCLELLGDDWHFDSSCDWLTGPAERMDEFICFSYFICFSACRSLFLNSVKALFKIM